jgi:hypothetical protein
MGSEFGDMTPAEEAALLAMGVTVAAVDAARDLVRHLGDDAHRVLAFLAANRAPADAGDPHDDAGISKGA